jgi:hypothetical protein
MTSDEITKENAGVIAVAQMAMAGNLEMVFPQRLHTSDYDMVMLLHTQHKQNPKPGAIHCRNPAARPTQENKRVAV